MPKPKLTFKQQRFVDAYVGNATDAARKAGYKGNYNTLHSVGVENLQKPSIIQAIRNREQPKQKKLIADRAERQTLWTNILRKELTRIQSLPDGSKIEVTPDFKEILKASELLGRSEADFTDKLIVGIDEGLLNVILEAIPHKDWREAVRKAVIIYAKSLVK